MDISCHMLDKLKNSILINQILDSISVVEFENLFLTGGILRNLVWNYLHGFDENYCLEDCDIIFYNPIILSKDYENKIQKILENYNPSIKWSVKNQARMHLRNGHSQYLSIFDALSAFPETCSAVAIGFNWNIIAPYGLIDLLNFRVKPTLFCINNEYDVYLNRLNSKKWIEKWPCLITVTKEQLITASMVNSV